MSHDNSYEDWLGRLRGGDQAAAAQVFQRFAHRLIGLARRHLDPLMQPKVDPDDVLQSVFRSFFLRYVDGAADLGGWQGLWGLLTTITVRKCCRRRRYFRQDKRDVRREAQVTPPDGSSSHAAWEAAAPEPTPEHAAVLAETVEQLLTAASPRDRQIIVLSLQGHDSGGVSEQVGCTQRTVQRVLERVRLKLQAQDAADPEA